MAKITVQNMFTVLYKTIQYVPFQLPIKKDSTKSLHIYEVTLLHKCNIKCNKKYI